MTLRNSLLTILVVALIVGCGAQVTPEGTSETTSTSQATSASFDGLLAPDEPADAIAVHALKAVENGDKEVVVTGRVGGRVEPFVQDRAMFMLSDLDVEMCTTEGDHCETPWDACCEAPEKIIANAITVQVKDEAGQVVKQDLRTVTGLKPLAKISVRGMVSEQSDDVLVLDASSIYVHDETP